MNRTEGPDMTINEVSAYFLEACCLYDDPSIDPDDHAAVIDAALLSSDCDDFAWIMSRVTGWPAVTLMWNMGDCLTGHHSLVKAPDGRYLDITGWTVPSATAARAGVDPRLITETEFRHYPFFVEDAEDECLAAHLAAGAALGREPFTSEWIGELVRRYVSALPVTEDEPPSRMSP